MHCDPLWSYSLYTVEEKEADLFFIFTSLVFPLGHFCSLFSFTAAVSFLALFRKKYRDKCNSMCLFWQSTNSGVCVALDYSKPEHDAFWDGNAITHFLSCHMNWLYSIMSNSLQVQEHTHFTLTFSLASQS